VLRCTRGSGLADGQELRDLVRVHAQQVRYLLDDHVVYEIGEIVTIEGAELQRPAVEHDPRRYAVPARPTRQQAGERHVAVLQDVGVVDVQFGRYVLYRELHARQLLRILPFQTFHRIQDEFVEDLRPGPGQRDGSRYQPSAQSPAVPIAPGPAASTAPTVGLGSASVGLLPAWASHTANVTLPSRWTSGVFGESRSGTTGKVRRVARPTRRCMEGASDSVPP